MKESKVFTEKEVIRMLTRQRESDANVLKHEANISGFTAKDKVLKNSLVYKNEE